MSKILEKAGAMVQSCDWFASPVLLRYQTDEAKASKTGGTFSIVLIVLLIVAFYKSWLTVLEKKNVRSDFSIIREMDPTEITINQNEFILAVVFNGLNISDTEERYFDLTAQYKVKKYSSPSQTHEIELIPCPKSRFSQYGENFTKFYENLNLENGLCFPQNFQGKLEGKFTSESFQYLRLQIKRCSGVGCKDDQEFQTYLAQNQAFYLNFYFINNLFNPSELNPVVNYVEDKYFFMISQHHTFDVNMFLGEYQITTDEGLWPWREENVTKGYFIETTKTEERTNTQTGNVFGKFYFRKSDEKILIERDFRKIDDLLSYLGGLFGLIITVCGIFTTHYNQCCFQLQMCNKVFKSEEEQSEKQPEDPLSQTIEDQHPPQSTYRSSTFNFIVYLKYLCSCIVFAICPSFKWKVMKELGQQLEETRNQMNIDILLQKISFYERALQCLFTEEQIVLLCCQQKLSIKELREQRILFNMDAFQEELQDFEQGKKDPEERKKRTKKLTMLPNIGRTMQTFGSNNFIIQVEKDKDLKQQICSAIHRVAKDAENGNEISERILGGLRSEVIENYTGKRKGKLPSIRSKISKIQNRTFANQSVFEPRSEMSQQQSSIQLRKKSPGLLTIEAYFPDQINQVSSEKNK